MGPPSLILASASPRRAATLTALGIPFRVVVPSVDESLLPGEPGAQAAERLSRAKAASVAGESGLPVLSADTLVLCDGQVLGKPGSAEEAAGMLRALSGMRHRVLTAVAVQLETRVEMAVSESLVTFAELDAARISAYVASGEPFDKAGAYGIQGRAGAFVARLEGSYTGVMGLPLYETANLLRLFGVTVP